MTKEEAKGRLLDIQNRLNMTFRTVQEQEEYTALDMAIQALEQEKVGHWITRPYIYGVVFCSECGFELRIDDTKFCPNCGARMEGEE